MAILQVNGLNVTLKNDGQQIKLLQDVSFTVPEGKCIGILGESGSGKSMTMKALMGLLDKNFEMTGSAEYKNQQLIGSPKETLRKLRGSQIGMVLQNPMTSFDPLYTVGAQMEETFKAHTNYTLDEIKKRSIEALEKMRIQNPSGVLAKYPHQLSGGMLQRIMTGIAMAMEPQLLIADEPTTALDSLTQFAVLKEFKRIKEETGTAMIFISHDLGAISYLADEILVLNKGKLVDQGDLEHIMQHATDAYTKLLIGKRQQVMQKYKAALQGGRSDNA